ncbi:MAG: Bug family tripartite tricarboxylate transporter substrate binding protein [Curvibacter sp.]|nr:Bug family tripartite tricarboxylate transporter substrate binding protein [Curvibacter sp.]
MTPLSRRHFTLALAGSAWTAASQAETRWTDGPLHILVGYPPGGSTDRVARILADRLSARLGTPVIVDNKPGAGGRLAAQVARVPVPGQTTLMLANPAVMVVAPLVFKDNGYDPERDFLPLSQVNSYDFGLAVGAAVPVRELSHLLAWLRANPGNANFGVPATGSLPHFFGLMVAEKAKVAAQIVGYRGSAPLVNDLLGGQVPVAIDTLDTFLPQHQAGKLRILAVSGARRSAFAPQIPTFKEAGLDLAASGFNAFFAPTAMPRDKAEALARVIREIMQEPDTAHRFSDSLLDAVVSTPAQTQAMLTAYRAQWAPAVRSSGLEP